MILMIFIILNICHSFFNLEHLKINELKTKSLNLIKLRSLISETFDGELNCPNLTTLSIGKKKSNFL